MITVTKNNNVVIPGCVCYMGVITSDYKTLVKKFGKPKQCSGDNKVKLEWVLSFSDDTVATIYDWKLYDKTVLQIKRSNKKWNVGGRNKKALENVKTILESA